VQFDILIIGGGINGAGIARDAAGRGASVVLLEQGDLAGATSSASSKLVHGGLRYLEHYKFRLVREALAEREVLWRIAPHLVTPLRFVMPHRRGMRPQWMLRAGLFLYDTLAPRSVLPGARRLDLRKAPEGADLAEGYTTGFAYSDCAVDDSRLTVLNARDAADRGADIRTRSRVMAIARHATHWTVRYSDEQGGGEHEVEAKLLINAAGPWAGKIASLALGMTQSAIRLVRGSHLIVRLRLAHGAAYTLQNADGRIMFAIPYGDDFTLLGTTDQDHQRDPSRPAVTDAERDYILASANAYLRDKLSPTDIVHAYAGVRALYDDGASAAKDATREYVLAFDVAAAPILSVYGGKITTYRKLAEAAMAKIAPHLRGLDPRNWTAGTPLPGGDFAMDGRNDLVRLLVTRYPALDPAMLSRLAAAYGTQAGTILGKARSSGDLGRHFGGGLYETELRYLMAREWAITADDVLWRRSKLGLRIGAAEADTIASFMDAPSSEQRLAAE
jgi:glycerol-3-phosphate dehydrogenase